MDPFPSQAVRNHSPTGFAWGYGGSGPAQLALAILMDQRVPPRIAERFYQSFKRDCTSRLPDDKFRLSIAVVDRWIEDNVSAQEEQQTT